MSSVIQKLVSRRKNSLISPPAWLPNNIHYECIMGSRAYGVNASDSTDYDIYGFCIPPKEILFPYSVGVINGFDYIPKQHDWWQYVVTGVNDKITGKQYDFQIFNIVKYVKLCLDNNPNMIDSLFVPDNCVVHCTKVGMMLIEKRKWFLSKEIWHRYKGYAYEQLKKMDNKQPVGKRLELVNQFGYDVKYAYHLLRLMNEAQQILEEGDLDLQRSREQLKSIRRGEWTEERLKKEFAERIPVLEKVYAESKLPLKPDEKKIKQLMLNCLEEHYGSLSDLIISKDAALVVLRAIHAELQTVEHLLYEKTITES